MHFEESVGKMQKTMIKTQADFLLKTFASEW